MNQRQTNIIFGAALCVAGIAAGPSSAFAQTFQKYSCADGTKFIVAFYEYDKRAYLQIDGTAVTLARRVGVAGPYFSGSGVTLKIGKDGTTVRHLRRKVTSCEPT
jgi:hypothetical protein